MSLQALALTAVALTLVASSTGQVIRNITFDPESLLRVPAETSHSVTWFSDADAEVVRIEASMEDEFVAIVAATSKPVKGQLDDNFTHSGHVNISALFIGYNTLEVTLFDEFNNSVANGSMKMTVLLAYQELNDIFTWLMAVLVAILYLIMGATLDLEIVKGIIKKPVGPAVGVFCQYVLMPAISFLLGLALFPDDPLLRLGLFLNGSCPGGGASNMWTHLLGGSLDLSIMMTFISTVTAFAAVPFWVLVIGPVILAGGQFTIPFFDIFITVISLIIPCGIGILIQIYFPKTVKYFEKLLTPMSAFNLIFIFTFGIYAYLYVFEIFTWRMLVSGIALPSLGYLSGMAIAFLFKMPPKEIIAISVETGVQNYTIALIILQVTLESPAGEISAAVPAAATLFTPVPLLTMLVIKRVYDRVKGGSSLDITDSKLREVTSAAKTHEGNDLPAKTDGRAASNGGLDNPAMDLQDEAA
ncbi:ileal sodium/bile acid cotransporter-like [Penaeus monodon]|uniref:ileal sodium/bile acid cotransporter-like n=1 Tax=Penaeus monodon TaxID=6687 RepID=UPI0018A7804D|nr:ileal sodium/bile acid cotransporter-like [Penaeus monodon]XP_037794304.1 ileal sodium/bile acid cotransporter-like [Penaeus monodon]XP_037794305.1 ileal sodium/bile acid cotransporter-like [Penaeus monodon]